MYSSKASASPGASGPSRLLRSWRSLDRSKQVQSAIQPQSMAGHFVMPARRSDGEGQKAAPAMAESRSQEDAAQAAFKQRRKDAIDREKKGIRTDVAPLVNMESQK